MASVLRVIIQVYRSVSRIETRVPAKPLDSFAAWQLLSRRFTRSPVLGCDSLSLRLHSLFFSFFSVLLFLLVLITTRSYMSGPEPETLSPCSTARIWTLESRSEASDTCLRLPVSLLMSILLWR